MRMVTHRYNSELPFISDEFKGNKNIDGKFINFVDTSSTTKFSNVLKWYFSKIPKNKKQDGYKLDIIENNNFFHTKEDVIIWLGHASFFIRIKGVSILTDPCLYDIPFHKRQAGLPCDISDIKGLDYILVSHFHRDHFDIPTIKKILENNPQAWFLTPLDANPLFKKLKHEKYQEAAWFQKFHTKGVEIGFLPALHWNRRGLLDYNKNLWGSFYIKIGNKSIYFAGDTGYSDHFREIRKVLGKIDICLMPIGAYEPDWIMKMSHMNPVESMVAFDNLGGLEFIPMHYGTYDLSDEALGDPIKKTRSLDKSGKLNGNLNELKIGQTFSL